MIHDKNYMDTSEKRRTPRLYQTLDATLSHGDVLNHKAICKNISEGGVCLEVELEDIDERALWIIHSKEAKINIEISLTNGGDKIRAVAIIKWNKQIALPDTRRSNWGMEFIEIEPLYKNRLVSYIIERLPKKIPIQPGLWEFTLLIDGEDLDTGRYEYYPYTHQAIVDFRQTQQIIHQLKKGEAQLGYQEYVFARYCIGGEDTNLRAIESAYKASQIFRFFPLTVRRKILGDTHDLLMQHKEKIIELLIIEGHPRKLAEWEISGLVKGTAKETLDFYYQEMHKKIGTEDKEELYLTRRADGVVCLCPPRNASCSNSFTAILTFLAGNTLIVKPPLRSPISTIYLWKEVIHKALKINGAPNGTLNIVLGNSKKIMGEWLDSPYVKDIIYFGESEIGLNEIALKALQSGKKTILELSGNDMLFVWKDADIDRATDALLDGFLGSTQICMVPKKAIIHAEIFDKFKKTFVEKAKGLNIGLPNDPETILSLVVKIKEYFEFLEDAITQGADLLCGGKQVNHNSIQDEKGLYIEPTVISIDNEIKALKMRCIKEENFFPLIPLVKISGSDEEVFDKMVQMSNRNTYGLRTSVWVIDEYYANKFMDCIHNTGLLKINARHVGFSLYLSTHGGVGKTGGPYGELNYMWQKTSHLQGISKARL